MNTKTSGIVNPYQQESESYLVYYPNAEIGGVFTIASIQGSEVMLLDVVSQAIFDKVMEIARIMGIRFVKVVEDESSSTSFQPIESIKWASKCSCSQIPLFVEEEDFCCCV